MNGILEMISKYGDKIIILSGIALLISLIINYVKLLSQKDRIKELLERRNRKYKKNKDTHELEEEDDEGSSVTPDTIRRHENSFNEFCSWHSALAQLIPIFPLMGVFGTVAGLMQQVRASEIEAMLSSLDTALTTTFWGLLVAIVLKTFDVLLPSRIINDVEVMLDNFEKKLELSNLYDEIKK